MSTDGLRAATDKMRAAGVPELAVSVFSRFHYQLRLGGDRHDPRGQHRPAPDVAHLDDVRPDEAAVAEALGRTVVIKLNGGLGTSMGMSGAKSPLSVRDGLTFLDIIARQVLAPAAAARRADPAGPHELLPHPRGHAGRSSRATRTSPVDGLPLDFLQNKEPKLLADDLGPVEWPDDPDLEWCPPGHGDLYTALQATGLLDTLLEHGYRYAFVSNSDNLGATCEGAVPAWLAREGVPFAIEVLRPHPQRPQGRPLRACARATGGSCCATARWSPRARTTSSRTPTGTRGSTRTTCGSTST